MSGFFLLRDGDDCPISEGLQTSRNLIRRAIAAIEQSSQLATFLNIFEDFSSFIRSNLKLIEINHVVI